MPRKTRSTQSPVSPVKYKQKTLLSHFSPSPLASSQKKDAKSKPRKFGNVSRKSADSEFDAERVDSPARATGSHKRRASPVAEEDSDSSDVGRILFEAQSPSLPIDQSDSDAEAEPLSPNRPIKRHRILNSDSEDDDNDRNRPHFQASRRIIKRDLREIEPASESDASGKTKSRLRKGKRSSSGNEDDDILSGIEEDKIINSRLRDQRSQKNRFLKNLERLKKKKRGLRTSESEDEAPSDDTSLIPGAHPRGDAKESKESDSDDAQDENSEEELNDFIVEDEGDTHAATLPAMFSMNTHQDLIHHFKVVCQYLVHLAVTTAAARSRIAGRLTSDEYFSVPLSVTRRKLGDIRDSIASSVWRPAYRKALSIYPEFTLHDLDFTIPNCDACHLGGRLSTLVGRLGGDPYDRTTFESRTVDSEDSSADSDEERGHAPEYNLGRFCARRTSVYHELCHWEHELFRALSREIEELSRPGRDFVRIGYAGGMEPPEDVSDADQIMEWLDQRGIINAEWLKVKQLMSRATNLEADVKRGREDD